MQVIPQEIPELLLIEPKVFGDARGYFKETFHAERYAAAGMALPFVQDNVSRSRRGILRGLHMQNPYSQGKLVSVLEGEVYDVAVDVRLGSPTFGRWVGMLLSAENHRQFYVPPGFAHGFCVTSEVADVAYKCSSYYDAATESGIAYDDPAIGIEWPIGVEPIVSERDATAPRLGDVASTLPFRV